MLNLIHLKIISFEIEQHIIYVTYCIIVLLRAVVFVQKKSRTICIKINESLPFFAHRRWVIGGHTGNNPSWWELVLLRPQLRPQGIFFNISHVIKNSARINYFLLYGTCLIQRIKQKYVSQLFLSSFQCLNNLDIAKLYKNYCFLVFLFNSSVHYRVLNWEL